MLQALRNPFETTERRDWAAEKAAPYVHPRLNSVDNKLSGELAVKDGELVDRPPRETLEEWVERRRRELAQTVAGVGTTTRATNGGDYR